ncbi:MAG: hypothetical protein IKZ87_03210, partial [Actinomycetaceae bacterium]|nr:hypothetical protein [Actinomycetaceae bacterium]
AHTAITRHGWRAICLPRATNIYPCYSDLCLLVIAECNDRSDLKKTIQRMEIATSGAVLLKQSVMAIYRLARRGVLGIVCFASLATVLALIAALTLTCLLAMMKGVAITEKEMGIALG